MHNIYSAATRSKDASPIPVFRPSCPPERQLMATLMSCPCRLDSVWVIRWPTPPEDKELSEAEGSIGARLGSPNMIIEQIIEGGSAWLACLPIGFVSVDVNIQPYLMVGDRLVGVEVIFRRSLESKIWSVLFADTLATCFLELGFGL